MLKYIGKRLLVLIPTLLCITFLVQLFLAITPGDPARLMAGNQASEEEVEALREEMGLNDPVLVRYAHYMINLFQGNLGKSFRTKNPVISEISERFPYTLLLVFISVILSLLIGIPTGIYAATHQYSWKDNLSILLSLFFVSMPSFWFALLLIQFLCVKLKILPVAGVDSWVGWILPCLTCALAYAASVARQMRSNMLEVIRQDYIVTVRAKGQVERKILYRHALKNAIIPIVQIVGSLFGMSLGGAMIAEVIFSVPGLGSYMLTGLTNRDYPVIQATTFFMSLVFSIVIILVDILFAFIDPRIRSQYVRRKKKQEVKELNKAGGEA